LTAFPISKLVTEIIKVYIFFPLSMTVGPLALYVCVLQDV